MHKGHGGNFCIISTFGTTDQLQNSKFNKYTENPKLCYCFVRRCLSSAMCVYTNEYGISECGLTRQVEDDNLSARLRLVSAWLVFSAPHMVTHSNSKSLGHDTRFEVVILACETFEYSNFKYFISGVKFLPKVC